jgi:uncharacterized integral membrane protein
MWERRCTAALITYFGLDGGDWSASVFGRLTLRKQPPILIYEYLLTAIGLTPGGSSTVHISTQRIHRTTQLTTLVGTISGIRTQNDQTKINDELTA